MTTMRALAWRALLFAAALGMLLGLREPARGDTILYEPVSYYIPTSYVTRSYYVPTSYVATSYVAAPTVYLAPTTYYAPTRYVVRRYRPVTTTRYTVVPTTYYLPTTTTLDLPVLATSASVACCDPAPVICDTAPAAERPVPPPASSGGTSSGSQASPAGEEPEFQPGTLNSTATQPRSRSGSQLNNETDTDRPLVPPPADTTSPPAAPPATERESYRPKLPAASTARSTLSGRVLSVVSGQPEKGVEVVIANAVGRFKDKTVTTNDKGEFSVVLPESDWIVKVPKTDGTGTIDADVTVSGGLVTDSQNREVSLLTINR
jgi:hypothetical protein